MRMEISLAVSQVVVGVSGGDTRTSGRLTKHSVASNWTPGLGFAAGARKAKANGRAVSWTDGKHNFAT